MKNPFTGRDSLGSRVSTVDGSIHINRAMRDAHDAAARARKMAENSRKLAEQARKSAERARKKF